MLPSRTGLHRAVVGTLVYVGVMSLGIMMLRSWAGSLVHSLTLPTLRASTWLATGGGGQIRWSFAAVGILLVLYLWVSYRSRDRGGSRLPAVQYVGAALLVLMLQWALVVSLRGIPEYLVIQLFP